MQSATIIRFWPAERRPAAAAAVAMAIGFAGAVGWAVAEYPLAGLACAAALAWSLRDFFFPTEYRFGPEGIEVRCLGSARLLPWRRFRAFVEDRNGFFLSPFTAPHRAERVRGVFLALDREARRAVRPLLEERLTAR